VSGPAVLLVEDDAAVRTAVARFLRAKGYQVSEVCRVAEAVEAVRARPPEVVLADYRLPDGTALDLLPRVRELEPELPVIVLTGHASVDLAVSAIKAGAEHFLVKPVEMPALALVLERELEHRRIQRSAAARRATEARAPDPFRGPSAAIRRLAVLAERVAGSSLSVLLGGETGVGKGVLARWLHRQGERSAGPYVDLNCAGLPTELVESELFGHERGAFTGATSAKAGLLEVAHGGTLFLDEIGDMPLAVQAKLLKVLEERRLRRVGELRDRRVDLRLIAATHRDLAAQMAVGAFRSDLYYRIATVVLTIPPLRERREDIVPIAEEILRGIAIETGQRSLRLDPGAAERLRHYDWPGNVRELRNVLERAGLFAAAGWIREQDLLLGPPGAAEGPARREQLPTLRLDELEAMAVAAAMRETGGNVREAAGRLGIHRATLYEKLGRQSPKPTRVVAGRDG
jgi:DNA-binding NtrC family response regulator